MKKIALLVTFALSQLCFATVSFPYLKTEVIQDVVDHVDGSTLVVFDTENVVYRPDHQLGTEQWFHHMRNRVWLNDGQKDDVSYLWDRVTMQSTMAPVDRAVQATIRRLQRSDFAVLGFAPRSSEIAYAMINHLRYVDADFRRTDPCTRNPFELAKGGKVINGVLFTGCEGRGGKSLLELITKLDCGFDHLVFISQSAHRIDKVAKAIASTNLRFTGIRYTKADEWVNGYRHDIAEEQLKHFNSVLSNEEFDILRPRWFGWF